MLGNYTEGAEIAACTEREALYRPILQKLSISKSSCIFTERAGVPLADTHNYNPPETTFERAASQKKKTKKNDHTHDITEKKGGDWFLFFTQLSLSMT